MGVRFVFVSSLMFAVLGSGCALFDRLGRDGEPRSGGDWVKLETPGAKCADGSPYAIYVQFSDTGSDNLMLYFQPGGACWDYASCTPGGGARSAANLDGLPDNYASEHDPVRLGDVEVQVDVKVFYPLLSDDPSISPMADWNKVFVPYCTGDGFSGSSTVTYVDPAGVEPDNVVHHVGHLNVLAMIDRLQTQFDEVNKLFVGGGSAGGFGALANYHALRTGLNVTGQGYLLNDSGPVFPAAEPASRSTPLYETVREVWNLDALIDGGLPLAEEIKADFGRLNTVLADTFPTDRFAVALYRLDYVFSLYSYERFYRVEDDLVVEVDFDGSLGLDETVATDRTAIYSLWWDDIDLLTDLYDSRDNLGYFIDYWRQTNSSHVLTIPGLEESPPLLFLSDFPNLVPELVWAGTEIGTADSFVDIADYVDVLLDDEAELGSYFEVQPEGPFVPCAPAQGFDADACEAVAN